jgi:hypothetical protein
VTVIGLLEVSGAKAGDHLLITAAGSTLSRMLIAAARAQGIKTIGTVRRPEAVQEVKDSTGWVERAEQLFMSRQRECMHTCMVARRHTRIVKTLYEGLRVCKRAVLCALATTAALRCVRRCDEVVCTQPYMPVHVAFVLACDGLRYFSNICISALYLSAGAMR